jgi:hypothetical protein
MEIAPYWERLPLLGLNFGVLGRLLVHCGKTFLRLLPSMGWGIGANGPGINFIYISYLFSYS